MELRICFTKPHKFKIGSWLIQLWTGKPYSHVAVRYQDHQGRELVFQASKGLVHLVDYYNFRRDNQVVSHIVVNIDEYQFETFRDFCYDYLGEDYSHLDLVKLPLHEILLKFGVKSRGENSRGYICSELTGEMLSKVLDLEFSKPFNYLRPDDIEESLNGQKYKY